MSDKQARRRTRERTTRLRREEYQRDRPGLFETPAEHQRRREQATRTETCPVCGFTLTGVPADEPPFTCSGQDTHDPTAMMTRTE